MNLKKIELGINLDEPVHISAAEYRPHPRQGEIDPETRPYQHQFEWYEDYYSNVGEEIAKKTGGSEQAKGWLLPMLYFDMGPNNLFRLLRQGAVDAYGMGRGVTVP